MTTSSRSPTAATSCARGSTLNKTAVKPTESPAGTVPEADFYSPVTGPATRPRRTLKHDDTFAVVDSHGDIGATAGGPDGIFHADTRFLSRCELLLNGLQLLLLGSNIRDDNSTLTVDLTNPDIYFEQKLILPKDTLHIVRTIFLYRGTAYQRFGVRNHGDSRISLRLSFAFASDFADVFEVRGIRRRRRGIARSEIDPRGQVRLHYEGLDGRTRTSALTFDPVPTELVPGVASYEIALEPKQRCSLFLAVTCDAVPEFRPMLFFRGMIAATRELRNASGNATTVETSNELFNQVLCQSMADLNMLLTKTPQGHYPYAGIPWYSTTFGRDGIITAMQMLWCYPDLARGVLRRL